MELVILAWLIFFSWRLFPFFWRVIILSLFVAILGRQSTVHCRTFDIHSLILDLCLVVHQLNGDAVNPRPGQHITAFHVVFMYAFLSYAPLGLPWLLVTYDITS